MSVRVQTFRNTTELAQFLNSHGLGMGDFTGPFFNNSGMPYVFYFDENTGMILPTSGAAIGVSWGTIALAGTIEVMAKRTTVLAEALGAIVGLPQAGILANTYVMPGTVVFSDSGATGPVIVDDEMGFLVEQGTIIRRGTIDYGTGAFAFTYLAVAAGSGNLTADYEHSDLPDSTDVPDSCILRSISVRNAVANIAFEIYENSAKDQPPAAVGTVVVNGSGNGHLVLDAASTMLDLDLSKRNRRWVVVDGACDVLLRWQRMV